MPQRFLIPLWAACSFLTRLAPGRPFTDAEMAAAPPFFPLAGLGLGLGLCLVPALGLAGGLPALQAVLGLLWLFWATRGLHWDGLADCADAWGSGKRGDAFWAALKDSRVGAFGVMGIALVFALQLVCLATLFSRAQPAPYAALLLAPACGRAAMLIPPVFAPPHPGSSLGRLVRPFPRTAALWLAGLALAYAACLGPRAALLCCGLTALALVPLIRMARREGGFNGDVLGCACLLAESAAWLAALA